MRYCWRALLLILPLCSLFAYSQEPTTVRIGVAVLRGNAEKISYTDARDRMVKALNQHKADKKWKFSVQAVALDQSVEGKALEEAKAKGCELVIFPRLADLRPVSRFEMSTLQGPGDVVARIVARVEYDMRRSDGEVFVIGSAQSDEQSTSAEAVLRAVEFAAREVMADLDRGMALREKMLKAVGTTTPAVSATSQDVFFMPDFCAWLPSNIDHADALRGVCEYAIGLPKNMPSPVVNSVVT